MIKKTGVRVTKEHRDIVLARARGVADTPMIRVHGTWLHEDARVGFGDWLDKLAILYGLPEPQRDSDGDAIHYGMEMDGEFTQWVGEADDCPGQEFFKRPEER